MGHTTIFESQGHVNILLEDYGSGVAIQANQHVIIHGDEAMILDPGGHKVYRNVLAATLKVIGKSKLKHIFLSHQDPDIVAAINGWLMTTDADAWASKLWSRFIPHFGLDRFVIDRLKPIDDGGMLLPLGGVDMVVVPAHFLHSCGNFHVYDPVSKIIYTSDLGASIGQDYITVTDFESHIKYMEGFHRRYMGSTKAIRAWTKLARTMDIEVIAPQHGAIIEGKEMVAKFIDWLDTLEVGIDIMDDYKLPV